jgi:DNA-binding response OmpR family regulator
MLALALETAGFAVCEAGTEIELQRVLARTRPDALLIDLQRSEREGLQLVARMHARVSLRGVPILFLAGSDDGDFRRQALEAGADWFGLRPVGLLDLQAQVAELIAHRGAQQPSKKRVG